MLFGPLSFAITSLGKERASSGAFVRLFDLRLFGFVCFLFLLVSGKVQFVILVESTVFSTLPIWMPIWTFS